MKNPMNPWRLTLILLSVLSLISCDRDNDNELTVPDLDKPTATMQLTLENAPIMDGSDSTEPLRSLLMCRLLGVECQWYQKLATDGTWGVTPVWTTLSQGEKDAIQKILLNRNTHGSFVSLIDGNDATINPYIRNANSGSQEKMETIVMNGLQMIDWPEMVGYVMLSPYFQLEQDGNSIAYTPFYYYDTIVNDDRTQVIGVNGVTPGKKTIENNSYPYVTEVMASVRADVDRSSTAYQLFYQLAAGQHNAIVKESGYIVCKR